MLCSDIHFLSEWMLSWTERWVGGGGSRCDDRRGSRTSLGGLEQSIPSYTHRPTSYTAAANAWPSSLQSDTSRIFRVYIKNRPFPEDTERDSYMCHIRSFNRERKTSNTPDGDTFLIEKKWEVWHNLGWIYWSFLLKIIAWYRRNWSQMNQNIFKQSYIHNVKYLFI